MIIGVCDFIIYDNESSDGTSELLQAISKIYGVEKIDWKTVEGVSTQKSVYADAKARIINTHRFIGFIDIDEFIFTVSDSTLEEILFSFPDEISAVAINQRVFGSSGRVKYTPELVCTRFTTRAKTYYDENRFFKSISRPERIDRIESPHDVIIASGEYIHSDGSSLDRSGSNHSGASTRVVDGPIKLNHYIIKSYEEFLWKRNRGAVWEATHEDRFSRYKDDNFFFGRDPYVNEEEDLYVANMHELIKTKMREIIKKIDSENTRFLVSKYYSYLF